MSHDQELYEQIDAPFITAFQLQTHLYAAFLNYFTEYQAGFVDQSDKLLPLETIALEDIEVPLYSHLHDRIQSYYRGLGVPGVALPNLEDACQAIQHQVSATKHLRTEAIEGFVQRALQAREDAPGYLVQTYEAGRKIGLGACTKTEYQIDEPRLVVTLGRGGSFGPVCETSSDRRVIYFYYTPKRYRFTTFLVLEFILAHEFISHVFVLDSPEQPLPASFTEGWLLRQAHSAYLRAPSMGLYGSPETIIDAASQEVDWMLGNDRMRTYGYRVASGFERILNDFKLFSTICCELANHSSGSADARDSFQHRFMNAVNRYTSSQDVALMQALRALAGKYHDDVEQLMARLETGVFL